ncbi:MAG: hypothetical protein LIO56_05620 [Lachnospiraceae bacterium]|nr:hypothetical protein [Clostridiales bacterium]MCC8141995.1 hypothetical protein [Lachnospiraceae bacterium]
MNERDNDYKHLQRERMISLADLIEEIWRKIWLIIILAVVFAVLCAGYKYLSDRSKAEAAAKATSQAAGDTSLTEEEMSEVNSVWRLYDQVSAAEQYMTDSIRMNIDPYHEDRVTMQYAIKMEDGGPSDLLEVFETYVEEGGLGNDLQESYPDVDAIYLTELVSVVGEDILPDTSGISSEAESEEIVQTNSIFSVQVINGDEDEAAQLADAVEQCMNSYAKNLGNQLGAFSLTLVDRSAAQVYDSTLKSEQTSVLTDQITLQNRITTQTENFSDEQTAVLDNLLASGTDSEDSNSAAEVPDDSSAQTEAAAKVHISGRYILLGVVIGIVLGIIIIILYYLARGTLNIAQEMPGEFGISVFGQIHEKKVRNPLVRAWRRVVYKKKPLPLETERQIVLANLKTFCKKNGIDHILLTGTGWNLTENESLQEIRTALAENGIEAEIAGGLPDSPETLELLLAASPVVLVETLHKSYYRNVVRETELCVEQGVQMAGAIVLE